LARKQPQDKAESVDIPLWKKVESPSLPQDDANTLIRKALEHIDNLKRPYRDEEEANQQLFSILKAFAPDKDIEYQPKYNGQPTGDIRIDNAIIEGKLDPSSITEIDRLIGQIDRYCKNTPYKIKVVIYGIINQEAIERILDFSALNVTGRVSLINLPNPQRRRRGDKSGGF
jgi:hypothetical protein